MDPRRDRDPALDELVGWDSLPPSRLAELAADPEQGARLELLQRAEAWLTSAPEPLSDEPLPEEGPPTACPDAEELYSYGRGPGYEPLTDERRFAVDRHLETCAECRGWIGTLAAPPPQPILDETPVLAGPRPAGPARTSAPSPSLRWVPAAAAAAVLTVGYASWRSFESSAARGHFPTTEILRGDDRSALFTPRDQVLGAAQPGDAPKGLFAGAPSLELVAEARADGYRVRVLRHDGGAFSTGEVVFEAESDQPVFAHPEVPVQAGSYTWEAWVVVDGLERFLGQRDFVIVDDPDTLQRVRRLCRLDRASEAVELLHERGYRTDARGLAATLPASPERDAYLGQRPGR